MWDSVFFSHIIDKIHMLGGWEAGKFPAKDIVFAVPAHCFGKFKETIF